MAFLRRKLDGGYIIKTHAKSFTTLQVRKEGVAFLSQLGIKENGEVPHALLKYMLHTALVFTMHPTQRTKEPLSLSSPISLIEDMGPRMAIREDQHGWHFALVFPEIPVAWMQEIIVHDSSTVMQTCGLCVDGVAQNILPITKLWPGKGGAAWFVQPHAEPYTIEPVGPWPSDWDLQDWTVNVAGLQTMGMLFDEEEKGGVFLKEGKSLIIGNSYIFVAHIDSYQTLIEEGIFPLPVEVQPSSLGLLHNWESWVIQLPLEASSGVYDWCNHIKHPLEKPLWKLELISPPPLGYSADGSPIVERKSEVIVAAIPPSPLSEKILSPELFVTCNNLYLASVSIDVSSLIKDLRMYQANSKRNSPFYFTLQITQNGRYRLQSFFSGVAPLAFSAISSELLNMPESLLIKPSPLQVLIMDNISQVLLRSFDPASRENDVFYTDALHIPNIEVQCPIPVNLSWSYSTVLMRIQAIDPKNIFSSIEDHVRRAAKTKEPFILYLDADNFGSLQLRFLVLPEQEEKRAARTPRGSTTREMIERMRWLSATLPAFLRQGAAIPIPHSLQLELSQLKDWPEGARIAQLTQVPRVLLPHLIALVRMISLHKQDLSEPMGGNPLPHIYYRQNVRGTSVQALKSSSNQGDESHG